MIEMTIVEFVAAEIVNAEGHGECARIPSKRERGSISPRAWLGPRLIP
jgi:hypothetical protein